MKKIWYFVFLFFLFYQCNDSTSQQTNPLSLVPKQINTLIKINSDEGLKNGINNNAVLKTLDNYASSKAIDSFLSPFETINKDAVLMGWSKADDGQLDLCLIMPSFSESTFNNTDTEISLDSTFKNQNGIKRFQSTKSTFYGVVKDSIFFVSNRLKLTEQALSNTLEADQNLEAAFNTADRNKMASVFIKHTEGQRPLIFEDSILNAQKFSDYSLVDVDISQNSITLNGITKANDSSNSLINIFKNTVPKENKIATIVPADIDYFNSFTVDNVSILKNNMVNHKFQDTITDHEAFLNIQEFGQFKRNNESAVYVRSIDPEYTIETISDNLSIADQFRSIDIYEVDDRFMKLQLLSPLVTVNKVDYAINIDDFFVFSSELGFLQDLISNYLNNSTLAETEAFKNLKLNLSDEASILIYRNAANIEANFNANFEQDVALDLSKYTCAALQFVYDTDFAHINGVFESEPTNRAKNAVTEVLNISLTNPIILGPQIVKNHTNGEKDIVVQDIQNHLYLISNEGKVLWKKQLDGKILGGINQIDTYKNGRLQLVFNTAKRLYVLDRNGNDVNAFPLKFNDDITQPVSVFDYDKRKDYRMLITQGKSVFMYDKNGKLVSGFTYKKADDKISTQPKHFRIGRKDFIVFSHGNKIEILNRVGKTRVDVKEKISFSDNDIYLYNNRFTTTNTNGELLEINQSGTVSHKNLNANSEHKIATTSKTLVVLNDNKLSIKSKTINLDFGDYTAPRIFYINDKIYVTVTDLQSKKGYLFDSQAKPIPNFPVYANSELELANIDKDKALEVITKGDNDAIIIYEVR